MSAGGALKGPKFARAALALIALALAACVRPPPAPSGAVVAGPYRLVVAGAAGAKAICYEARPGRCLARIDAPVILYGADADFVSAAAPSAGDPAVRAYYFIVRDFDGPYEDATRAVRGPMSESAFAAAMAEHGVPAPTKPAV